jgi:hypothetical protein
MANTIRIKRRASGATGAPSALANAELAFNEVDGVLYYGEGGTESSAASIISIGGSGAFTTLDTVQTVTGNKTFSGTVTLGSSAISDTKSAGDNSTSVATTAYVDSAVTSSGSGLSVNADSGSTESILLATESLSLTGGTGITTTTGTNAVTFALDNTAVAAASYGAADTVATFTVDAQGRLTAAADASISIVAAAVTDFDTQVRTSRLDQMATPTADVAFGSVKLTGVADPTQNQDAATKAYVDNVAAGIHTHEAARVATASGLPSYSYNNGSSGVGAALTGTSNGALTVDGVSVTSGDRVLVKDEGSGNEAYNGIYSVTTVGDGSNPYVLTRTDDFDEDAEFPGSFVFVEEGTVNADNGFVCTTDSPITVGTTAIAFTQFSGAGQVIAGDGLTKNGNTLDVVGTTNRIVANANSIDIDTNYVGQASIHTLGTVTTGTWNATVIDVLYGGTGATDASGARTNLGLVIGTDVQTQSDILDDLSNLTQSSDTLPYFDSSSTAATTSLTAFGRSLIAELSASDARTSLGVAIGTDVQAYDAELATLAGMTSGTATALAALTQTEVEVIDGSTSATATTLASTDTFVVNAAGTMVQVALSDLVTFFEDGATSSFDVDGGSF